LVRSQILNVDSNAAIGIASRFLEQHYSILDIKDAAIKDHIWIVTVVVSSFGESVKKIRIDAATGEIIDWR